MTDAMKKERGKGLSYEEKKKRGLLTISDIHDHFYVDKKGEPMSEQQKNGKAEAKSNGLTLSQLKLKARQGKVRGWYAMNSDELQVVLNSKTAKAISEKTSNGAIARWKQYNAKYAKVNKK